VSLRFIAVVGCTWLAAAGLATAATRPPARVEVTAHEFSFTLSRQTVHAGVAIIELVNFGQDAHDLRLQRRGAKHIAGTPVVLAGARYDLKVVLHRGRYTLWCGLADHRARGMSATLVVR
jgi:plastocyanin